MVKIPKTSLDRRPADLFLRLPLVPKEFRGGTSAIGKIISLFFQELQEHPIWTSWKNKKIIFPIALVPPRNSLEADGNHENKSAGHLPEDVLGNWAIITSYRVQWRRSRTLWKDKDEIFQSQLVSHQNTLGVNRNH